MNLKTLFIHFNALLISNNLLLGHYVLITLRNNRNEEVEELDQDDELIQKPEGPDQENHYMALNSVPLVDGLKHGAPVWVHWRSDVADRISPCLKNDDRIHIQVGVVIVAKFCA